MMDKFIFSEDRKVSLRKFAVALVNCICCVTDSQKVSGSKLLSQYPEAVREICSVGGMALTGEEWKYSERKLSK
jgi:hypothetical protein